ncbi:hypothetical protein AB0368_07265 [Actinoplanes sp. NPDC051475]|uniref:hypothetical protein n=1 Tax=Actinoplanes sp. NPDC051475 TaxID=3157225 RepID=UPI00344DC6B1
MRNNVRQRPWPAAVLAAGVGLCLTVAGTPALAAPVTPSAAAIPTPKTTIGEAEAAAQAATKGEPVAVTAATTATSTLTANPDGSFTLTQAVQPVRKLVGGVWKDLDATLKIDDDGTITPTLATGDLHLSAGGSGPFATMAGGGSSLALTLPFSLPKPTLAGPTATYADVLPGVDLTVTADSQGGFSQVLAVADAKAAANPLLSSLAMATSARGLNLSADAAGNIVGTDVNRRTVVTAPAPIMWDSTVAADAGPTVTDPSTKRVLDARTGMPARSSAHSPGLGARTAKLGVAVAKDKITLTPSKALLDSAAWPVYVDPAWSWGAAQNGYAVIDNSRPSTNYWKSSPSTLDDLQSGKDPDGTEVRRTLLNFGIDTSKLTKDVIINSATLNITETWAYNCTASNVDIYAPNTTLTSTNATWNAWSGVSLGTRNDQVSAAYGYNSSCPAHGVGFDISTGIKAAAGAGRKTQTFVIKANDESSQTGWKRWSTSTPKITVDYDHKPNVPTGLKTSPTTACSGTTVGDHDIKLYATVSDPDGGTVSENFTVWKSTDGTVKTSGTLTNVASGSGSTPFTVKASWMKTIAAGKPTAFRWNVTTSQNGLTSAASTTCTFTFDPTRPHAPDVTPPTGATIGKPATFAVSYVKNVGETTAPASYQFQLNGGAVVTVTADSSGNATFSAVPMRTINWINVTSASAGSNFSPDAASEPFTAVPPAPAADADLTGDGNPDLLAVGGVNNMPAGVWVAPGTGRADTSLNVVATDIGAFGNGTNTTGSPADFNGAQVISGEFTGDHLQDLLYYYPSGSGKAGSGGVLAGNGDGSPITPGVDDAQHSISSGILTDYSATGNADEPMMLANAGTSSGQSSGFLDLIGIAGDDTDGYHLVYYPNSGGPTQYAMSYPLTTAAPDGTMNWKAWKIVTAQTPAGTTSMFLWNSTTGALYLWTGLTFTTDGSNNTLTYTSRVIADGTASTFQKAAAVTLRSGDINRDGTPDLWVSGASATATAWIVTTMIGTTATLAAQTSQTVLAASHAWHLNDSAGDASVTTAQDSSGALTATISGAQWNTGDMISPDLQFTGSTTSAATTTAKALSTIADFSVGFWAKPDAYDGTVVSQDGTSGPGFRVWPSADGAWNFAMQRTDAAPTSAVQDTAKSAIGTARLGLWYHVVVSYQASNKQMRLYVNDQLAATATHSTPWSAGGGFQIGTMRTSATAHDNHFKGQVAHVSTYNAVINPMPEAQHAVWDHARDPNGSWPSSGQLLDNNPAVSNTAAAALPDGTVHAFTLVPGSGIWERVRSASGVWSGTATKIDTNGSITDIAAVGLPNGTLHLASLVPGSGIWYRSRSAAGTWAASSTKIDANTAITDVSGAGLPDGTLHLQTIVPGSGVYNRIRNTAGTWGSASVIDTNTAISDVSAAALPDGTLHVQTLVPSAGVYDKTRSTTGTWSSSTAVESTAAATSVSSGADADGNLHVVTSLNGIGVFDRTRATSGTWAVHVQLDTNGTAIASYTAVAVDKKVHVGVLTNP